MSKFKPIKLKSFMKYKLHFHNFLLEIIKISLQFILLFIDTKFLNKTSRDNLMIDLQTFKINLI